MNKLLIPLLIGFSILIGGSVVLTLYTTSLLYPKGTSIFYAGVCLNAEELGSNKSIITTSMDGTWVVTGHGIKKGDVLEYRKNIYEDLRVLCVKDGGCAQVW